MALVTEQSWTAQQTTNYVANPDDIHNFQYNLDGTNPVAPDSVPPVKV